MLMRGFKNLNDLPRIHFCIQNDLSLVQFYGKKPYKGILYLNSLKKSPKNFNPIVDGSLLLNSVKKIPDCTIPLHIKEKYNFLYV